MKLCIYSGENSFKDKGKHDFHFSRLRMRMMMVSTLSFILELFIEVSQQSLIIKYWNNLGMGATKILILISFLIDPKHYSSLLLQSPTIILNVSFAKNIKVEIFYWSPNLIARHKTLHFNTPDIRTMHKWKFLWKFVAKYNSSELVRWCNLKYSNNHPACYHASTSQIFFLSWTFDGFVLCWMCQN